MKGWAGMDLDRILAQMHEVYTKDPSYAVRSQAFINILHKELSEDLDAWLTSASRKRQVTVVKEATIYGSHKPKNVDVSIIDPENGPLVMIGIRSQMSSVAKNALTYYEGIIGECISLQDRFPMATGYLYLMPLQPTMLGRKQETINHSRYARMYDAITGRAGQSYRDIRGVFDEFAYMVVDFNQSPPLLCDHLLDGLEHDLSVTTLVDRIIRTFKSRHIFLDVFK